MRHALLVPIALLAGCWDFTGDLEILAFSTNLGVGPEGAWRGDLPVAVGSRVRVKAEGRLVPGSEELAPVDVVGRVDGDLVDEPDEGAVLWVEGEDGAHGTVRFEGDAADHFQVAFHAVEAVGLHLVTATGSDDLDLVKGRLGFVEGGEAVLRPVLRDSAGGVLAWHWDALHVDGVGAVAAWVDVDGTVHVTADVVGPGSLVVSYGDTVIDEVDVVVVKLADVDGIELIGTPLERGGGEAVIAVGTTVTGTRVLGLTPTWTWDGEVQPTERPDVILVAPDAVLRVELDGVATEGR